MNPIIVTIVIATATFILSIFGALQFYSSMKMLVNRSGKGRGAFGFDVQS